MCHHPAMEGKMRQLRSGHQDQRPGHVLTEPGNAVQQAEETFPMFPSNISNVGDIVSNVRDIGRPCVLGSSSVTYADNL